MPRPRFEGDDGAYGPVNTVRSTFPSPEPFLTTICVSFVSFLPSTQSNGHKASSILQLYGWPWWRPSRKLPVSRRWDIGVFDRRSNRSDLILSGTEVERCTLFADSLRSIEGKIRYPIKYDCALAFVGQECHSTNHDCRRNALERSENVNILSRQG